MPCPVSLTVSLIFTRPRSGNARSGIRIKGDMASLHRHHAAVGHEVSRVDCEIEDRIVDISWIGQRVTRVRRALHDGVYPDVLRLACT